MNFPAHGGLEGPLSPHTVNKHSLLETIISHLQAELTFSLNAARATVAAATDGDSKAENKYDTRNLEASYLARGQAFRVAELKEALAEFEACMTRDFAPDQPINQGALVRLKTKHEEMIYFIGPAAGGTQVMHEGQEVLVTTISSPLGKQLLKKRAGDSFELQPGNKVTVLSVA